MWIVFGWDKEERPIGEIGEAYCYDCRSQTEWVVWNQSEWVTFSAIRTFRFLYKNRLHCESCTFSLELSSREFAAIKRHMRDHDSIAGTEIHDKLKKRIESEQLAAKTPLQLKFIRESMEAEAEYRERMKELDSGDDN